ncbi:MAG: bifunctional UDP-N-acetylglucosamine diphosphorylase/glucosamine-1-phosphate N-acetyltransferase GlmU [Nitrosomonas sp.]
MSTLNVIILAAGMGKRMQSSQPKVLHALAGIPLLSHVIRTARSLFPKKICIVIGHGGEKIKQAIAGDDLIWVMQEQQLGTGHAVMQAQPHLDTVGLTLILYGDVPLVNADTLKNLINISSQEHCALLTATMEDPSGYGRILRNSDTNTIVRIIEQKDANDEQSRICEINTGIMAIPNRHLLSWLSKIDNQNAQKEYYLTDIVEIAVDQGIAVKSGQPADFWEIMGVNDKSQLAELERIYQKEKARTLLNRGTTLMDPARIDIRGELICGSDVSIDINCIFEGIVNLGDGVNVGAHSVLKNVTVAAGTSIAPYSYIEDAQIGQSCKIGPFSRIRPGTVLLNDVHIGNFVEVKNSHIGIGSKANHLTYIGDSDIGERVNIGAGTITCNYDGANKHRTVIENDVFIGSDTQLIAPVRVSKGATIGAGSTITRDTPQDTLTLSRVKQVSIAGWKRPIKTKK